MIQEYGSKISEILMTARVNIDKKKELLHLKMLQCFVDYYARILKIADNYEVNKLRESIDRETMQKNYSLRNNITDQEIRYLIKLNIIQSIDIETVEELEDIQGYFSHKSEKNSLSLVTDKFRKYRAVQCHLLDDAIGYLLDEINGIKTIVSGRDQMGNNSLNQNIDQLKGLIDKLHGNIYPKNKEPLHPSENVESYCINIQKLLTSFPYKELKEQKKSNDKSAIYNSNIEPYTSIRKLQADIDTKDRSGYTFT